MWLIADLGTCLIRLIETEVDVAVFAVALRGPMGWLPNRLPAASHRGLAL